MSERCPAYHRSTDDGRCVHPAGHAGPHGCEPTLTEPAEWDEAEHEAARVPSGVWSHHEACACQGCREQIHYRKDGQNGETTACYCFIGKDHDEAPAAAVSEDYESARLRAQLKRAYDELAGWRAREPDSETTAQALYEAEQRVAALLDEREEARRLVTMLLEYGTEGLDYGTLPEWARGKQW